MDRKDDGQQVQWERAARGDCGVCKKKKEKKMLSFVLWISIAYVLGLWGGK